MITPQRLDQVVQIITRAGLNEQTVSALRETFAPVHFTWCQDDDIHSGSGAGEPLRSTPDCNLYLVDGRAHCLRFTTDPHNATGLVLAERTQDPD